MGFVDNRQLVGFKPIVKYELRKRMRITEETQLVTTTGHTQLPSRAVAHVGSFGYLVGNTTS